MNKTFLHAAASLVLGLVATLAAAANEYPNKPITVVVPFAPGAGTDTIARLVSQQLSLRLGQPVIVDNKAGAAGMIGTKYVAGMPPDGYTLLYTPSSFAFVQSVSKPSKSMAFDPEADFTPIIQVSRLPVFFVTGAETGYNSVRQVIEASKRESLSYGSAGNGSIMHIIGEVVKEATGANLLHVPYKGVAPAIRDVQAGQIPFGYGSLSSIKGPLAAGRMKILATTTAERSSLMPDVPSFKELGFEKVDLGSWNGIYGPKGLPLAIVQKLNENLNEVLKMPEIVKAMAIEGSSTVGGPPAKLKETTMSDRKKIGDIAQRLNLSVD